MNSYKCSKKVSIEEWYTLEGGFPERALMLLIRCEMGRLVASPCDIFMG